MATKKKTDKALETAMDVFRDNAARNTMGALHTLYGKLRYAATVIAAATDATKQELFSRLLHDAETAAKETNEEFDPNRTLTWSNDDLGGSVARQYRSGSLAGIDNAKLERRLAEHNISLNTAGTLRFIFDERKVIALIEEHGLALEDFGVWDFAADPKKLEKLVELELLPVEVVEEVCTFKEPTFAIQVADTADVLQMIEDGALLRPVLLPVLTSDVPLLD